MDSNAPIPPDLQPEAPTEPSPLAERGRKIASVMGRVTLYDPRGWDVSRANRPIEPAEISVQRIEEVITKAFEAEGYAVGIEMTRTDNER